MSRQAKRVLTRPLVAVNILPTNSIEELRRKVLHAKEMGFQQAWFNPICLVNPATPLHRIDPVTGVMANLYASRYAVDGPAVIDPEIDSEALKALIIEMKEEHDFVMMADFVWKHVGMKSPLLKEHPEWFKANKRVKDVIEYDFRGDYQAEIIAYLLTQVDVYLKEFGFGGLRIDAASHLIPEVRFALIHHIKKHYPDALILEEVLFESNQAEKIAALVSDGDARAYRSTYVTSNLYYQTPDAFGQLKKPADMGDLEKLNLADLGISFTGNHDHFSLAWGVIITLAAREFLKNPEFYQVLASEKCTPIKGEEGFSQKFDYYISLIERMAKQEISTEDCVGNNPILLRYLLPYANRVARQLFSEAESYDQSRVSEESLISEFRKLLFQRVCDRTLASPGGYFMSQSELTLMLETPCIFNDDGGRRLQQRLLTPEDIQAIPVEAYENLCKQLEASGLFSNLLNWTRQSASSLVPVVSALGSKKKGKRSKKKAAKPAKKLSAGEAFLLLPYVQTCERVCSESDLEHFDGVDPVPMATQEAGCRALSEATDYDRFIKRTNEIFLNLNTHGCTDYETFVSLEQYKIIVRCTEKNTDIIVLNLNPQVQKDLDNKDIEKIALWFQERKFPHEEMDARDGLRSPLDEEEVVFFDAGYSHYWAKKDGDAFSHAYKRIMGAAENHTTSLFLGPSLMLKNDICKNIKIPLAPLPLDPEAEAMHDMAAAAAYNPQGLFVVPAAAAAPVKKPEVESSVVTLTSSAGADGQ
ncbi:MAG: hypothetical protein K0U29_01855 [Gammaproteobacteria bacterium]|nr:hypothetical protein [Gammaproteobacteria bacterium]